MRERTNPNRPTMYRSIHACRALAALLVVCFHLAANLAKDKYYGDDARLLAQCWSFGGAAGVSFFFVLSGFIITYIHLDDVGKPVRLLNYILRRIVRIYPAYIIVFMAVYVSAILTPSLRASMPTDLVVFFKSLLLIPQDVTVVGGTGAPVIIVAWSLQYEVVFYLLVGFAIFNAKVFVGLIAGLLVAVTVNLSGFPLVFPLSILGSHLMLLFFMGMGVALVFRKSEFPTQGGTLALVSGLFYVFVVVVALIYGALVSPVTIDLGYGIAGSFLILGLVRHESERYDAYDFPIFRILGDSSYALYLLHFPLIAVLCKLLIAIDENRQASPMLGFVWILATVILASIGFHFFVETRVNRYLLLKVRKYS